MIICLKGFPRIFTEISDKPLANFDYCGRLPSYVSFIVNVRTSLSLFIYYVIRRSRFLLLHYASSVPRVDITFCIWKGIQEYSRVPKKCNGTNSGNHILRLLVSVRRMQEYTLAEKEVGILANLQLMNVQANWEEYDVQIW